MGKAASGKIRIGVGGWTYEPWRGTFYPANVAQKNELEYASRQLTSIEINGTYYGSQKPATFAWAAVDMVAVSVPAVSRPVTTAKTAVRRDLCIINCLSTW